VDIEVAVTEVVAVSAEIAEVAEIVEDAEEADSEATLVAAEVDTGVIEVEGEAEGEVVLLPHRKFSGKQEAAL
jgi:hypothetical protein